MLSDRYLQWAPVRDVAGPTTILVEHHMPG